jgi:hypothetical protein
MVSFFASVLASLALFPLLSFLLISGGIYLKNKNKKEAIQKAIPFTTFLLLISVQTTITQIWDVHLWWLLFIFISIIAIGLLYLQYTIRGEINYQRLWQGTVRLTFLFFLPIHILLFLWVFIQSAIKATI